MNDFLLIERAAQVQRLRAAKAGNRIDIPGRAARMAHSRLARRLFHSIDQICSIPLEEKRSWWLARMAERGVTMLGLRRSKDSTDDASVLLTPRQRDVLTAFERQVVELQLEHPTGSTNDKTVFDAILQDRANFDGLKPMQYHSDNFAHELLFPSWLNLYTALVLPPSQPSEPRFSHAQIKTIFRFLHDREVRDRESSDAELVGALTLLATRCPPLEAQAWIQQLMNLGSMKGRNPQVTSAPMIQVLQEASESAADFLEMLQSLVVFESCELVDIIESNYDLDAKVPRYRKLPKSVTKQIRAAGKADGAFARWAELVRYIARFSKSGGCVDAEYAEFLELRTDDLGDWLSFLTSMEDGKPLSAMCQRLLAQVVQIGEANQGEHDLDKTKDFARIMAPRLELLSGRAVTFFEQRFIKSNTNRELLLQSTTDHERRRKIARQLLALAGKASDRSQLLGQMIVAAVIDPDHDMDKLQAIRRTTHVLQALEERGFISSNQLEDLADDIRQRLPESLEFLAAPFVGAAENEGRLAKLYLALYEECEKYEHYGETGNFGLTTAAYGNLNRTIDRET